MSWIINILHKYIHTRMDQLYGILPYNPPGPSQLFADVITDSCSEFCNEKYGQNWSTDTLPYDNRVDENRTHKNLLMGMPEYLQKGLSTYKLLRTSFSGVSSYSFDFVSGILHTSEIYGTITDTRLHLEETNARILLRKYVNNLNISKWDTYRVFEHELSHRHEGAIFTLKYSLPYWDIIKAYPRQVVRSIHRMNELYSLRSIPETKSKEYEETPENVVRQSLTHIEYPYVASPHIDGVFAWLPWCRVIRCIVAIDGITSVEFPLSSNAYIIEPGDYLLYDYNRAIHITTSVSSVKPVLLNLHYIVYPEWFPDWVADIYMLIHNLYSVSTRTFTWVINKHGHTIRESVVDVLNFVEFLYIKAFLLCVFLWKSILG